MTTIEKIKAISYHIKLVQNNCYKLGLKLIEQGDELIGKNLIANSYLHDNTKFDGLEFEALWPKHPDFDKALTHHHNFNTHHPEYYYNGIKGMDKTNIAEMVCDWVARAQEFGTDVREWIDNVACKKYKIEKDDDCYKLIQKYLSIILTEKFTAPPQS